MNQLKKTMEEVSSEINLTEEEIENALAQALKKKRSDVALKNHWEKVNYEKVYPKFNSTQLSERVIQQAIEYIPGFKIDDQNCKQFELLAWYFTDDERFESGGFSLKKGIFLYGNVGCGKTTLMKIFRENQKASYKIVSCRTVASDFASDGHDAINLYSGIAESSSSIGLMYGHTGKLGICFDDLGTENQKRHFGNEMNVMEEVILNRYDKASSLRCKTHITSNLTADDIQKIYGIRVLSRMKEMFNFIEFAGSSPDRRK